MKLKAYIHAHYDDFDKEYVFQVWSQDMSKSEYGGPLVEVQEIDFTPPPNEVLVNGTIQNYRDAQKKIRADAESQCNMIQQRINDLLCLEHKTEDV